MAKEKVFVECRCIRDTSEGVDYYVEGQTYTLEMNWAKERDIWKWFEPLEEIPAKDVVEKATAK